MDFFTPYCKKPLVWLLLGSWLKQFRALDWQVLRVLARSSALPVLLLCLFFAMPTARAFETNTEISSLRAERLDDGLYLNATIRFDLPSVVEDALAKGIPMYFVSEAELFRDRWYWYDKRMSTASRTVRLAYQPLTRRWRMSIASGTVSTGATGMALNQSFDNLADALAAVRRISRWKIAELADFDPDSRHSIDFRFRLDLTQLPRPFQIGAVGQSEWNISAQRNVRPQSPASP